MHRYTYYVQLTVSSLQPADGPAAGGLPVTVHGLGFSRLGGDAGAARCRFGAVVLRHTLMAPSQSHQWVHAPLTADA